MAINFLLAVNLLVFVAINAARIVLSLYALDLGASPSTVGGILSMFFVFPLLISWPIGMLADRFSARGMLLAGTACGTGAMLIPYFVHSTYALFAVGALVGVTIAFMTVLGQNLVGILSAPHERTRNFSNYTLTGSLCVFIAPLSAGFAIDHLGHANACLAITALLVLAMVMLAFWGHVLPRNSQSSRTAPKTGLMQTLSDRALWRVLAISGLSQLGSDLYQAFLPIYAHGIGLSASVIGSVLAAFALGSFSVRIIMPRLVNAIGDRRLLLLSFLAGAGAFILVPLCEGPALLALTSLVFGMSAGCSQPLSMLQVFNQSAAGRAGETVGLRLTINNLGRIIAPALFGALGTVAGLLPVFWINALLMGGGGLLTRLKK